MFFQTQKYKQALSDFKSILNLSTNDGFSYEGMGDCYSKLNDYKTALAAYDKAIECNINCASKIFEKEIKLLYGLKKYDETIKRCDKVSLLNHIDSYER